MTARIYHDRSILWALNAASRGHASRKRSYGRITDTHGCSVYAARPNRPYSVGTKGTARWSHFPKVVYMAWRNGRMVGQLIRWRCGATSMTFQLTDKPDRPICRLCAAYVGVHVTVLVAS